jgi:hypothetical protein
MTERPRKPQDPRFAAIRVDNNFFQDGIGPVERDSADKLIRLSLAGELSICVPHSVKRELEHPSTPRKVYLRSIQLPFTYDTGLGSRARQEVVRRILRGNASSDKHRADADHVYDAACWLAGYFVTCDERFHRKSAELASVLTDLWIVKPSELMAIYDEAVRTAPRTCLGG